jgi:putative methionine-R-sulfoxide reductase with GAF domain
MSGLSLSFRKTALLLDTRRVASSASALESLRQTVVEVLSRDINDYSWTGFYMLDPAGRKTLVLGAFVGAPPPQSKPGV